VEKITELTEEQKAQFPVYSKKWLDIGLSTEPVNEDEARVICKNLYDKILNKPFKGMVLADSPLCAWGIVTRIVEQTGVTEDEVKLVRDEVRQLIKEGKKVSDIDYVSPYLLGNMNAGYFSFFDYMKEVLKIDLGDKWETYRETSKISLIYPLDVMCICSDKPREEHFKGEVLHRDGGPAISYNDGFVAYALNGVRVPKKIAVTPANKLNPKLFMDEKNVEIRREIVRKIGMSVIIDKMGAKSIDKQENNGLLSILGKDSSEVVYELLSFPVDGVDRKYLKMMNPSIGIWHVEGVPPSCNTVDDALNFRNGTTQRPEVLT